jgi:hypothetical protein
MRTIETVFFGPLACDRRRLAVLCTYREILKARIGRLWRDPIKTRMLLAKDSRAQHLVERLRRRLSDAGSC